MTNIYVTLGNKQYVGGTITETSGKDISTATFMVGLGDVTVPPTSWSAPAVSVAGASSSARVVKMLIDNTITPGNYYCWARIIDNPEIEPVLLTGQISVI